MRHALSIALVAVAVAGCGGRGDAEFTKQMVSRGEPVPASTRVDNGVTTYEHSPDAFTKAPQWTLEETPVSTMGGADGDPQFDLTRVYFAVLLSDGRVMTFAPVGNKVYVFRRDGKGERVIGRTGQGPGDWMAFSEPVLLENDTVLVIDAGNQRLNWVTADRGIVRTAPAEMGEEMHYMRRVSGFLPGGELLMHSSGSWGSDQSATDSLHRSIARIVATNIETGGVRQLGTIADMQGGEVETRYRGRVRTNWQPLRLTGYALVSTWDSLFASVDASSRTIELRDATGALGGRLEVPAERRAVTKAMRDAVIDQELASLKAPGSERMVDRGESERLARETPFVDSLPYFSHMMTSQDGTLWVVDAIAPSDSGWTATAFSKDGGMLGRLSVKEKSRPMAFGANEVIIRSEDENGVVMLRVYRLVSSS